MAEPYTNHLRAEARTFPSGPRHTGFPERQIVGAKAGILSLISIWGDLSG